MPSSSKRAPISHAVRPGQPVEVGVAAHPHKTFTGRVTAVSPIIDEGRRNFAAQARLANDHRLLRPGMFADVTVLLPATTQVVVVPATAISYSPAGDSAFLIRERRAAEGAASAGEQAADGARAAADGREELISTRVIVQTGERRGGEIAVLDGIAAGDRVVTAGQLKLYEGARVTVSDEDAADGRRA